MPNHIVCVYSIEDLFGFVSSPESKCVVIRSRNPFRDTDI